MDIPKAQIARALQSGRETLTAAHLPLEPESVGFAVERHRWAWKPEQVRAIAESHVFTSDDDFRFRIAPHRLRPEAQHAPTEYVRLIYCLGKGESHLLSPLPSGQNSGTPQFSNIFGRVASTGRQRTTLQATRQARVEWKVKTLVAMQAKDVWLLDASLHGVYAPGATRVPPDVTLTLHKAWWAFYRFGRAERLADSYQIARASICQLAWAQRRGQRA